MFLVYTTTPLCRLKRTPVGLTSIYRQMSSNQPYAAGPLLPHTAVMKRLALCDKRKLVIMTRTVYDGHANLVRYMNATSRAHNTPTLAGTRGC